MFRSSLRALFAIGIAHSLALGLEIKESCTLPQGARWCEVPKRSGQVTVGPFKIAAYGSNDLVSESICKTGIWELSDTLQDLLKHKPGVAMDIGANIGWWTFVLAHKGWTVHSFEPMQSNLALMDATLCANPEWASQVYIHRFALGRADSTSIIISDSLNQGDGIMVPKGSPISPGYQQKGAFEVKRLDTVLMKEFATSVGFVKIDVEGNECGVVEGGAEFFGHLTGLIRAETMWHQDCSGQDFWDHMHSHDWSFRAGPCNEQAIMRKPAEHEDVSEYTLCRRDDEL